MRSMPLQNRSRLRQLLYLMLVLVTLPLVLHWLAPLHMCRRPATDVCAGVRAPVWAAVRRQWGLPREPRDRAAACRQAGFPRDPRDQTAAPGRLLRSRDPAPA